MANGPEGSSAQRSYDQFERSAKEIDYGLGAGNIWDSVSKFDSLIKDFSGLRSEFSQEEQAKVEQLLEDIRFTIEAKLDDESSLSELIDQVSSSLDEAEFALDSNNNKSAEEILEKCKNVTLILNDINKDKFRVKGDVRKRYDQLLIRLAEQKSRNEELPEEEKFTPIETIRQQIVDINSRISRMLLSDTIDRNEFVNLRNEFKVLEAQLSEWAFSSKEYEELYYKFSSITAPRFATLEGKISSTENKVAPESNIIDLSNWPDSEHPSQIKDLTQILDEVATNFASFQDSQTEIEARLSKIYETLEVIDRQVFDLQHGFFSKIDNRVQVIDYLKSKYIAEAQRVIHQLQDQWRTLLNRDSDITRANDITVLDTKNLSGSDIKALIDEISDLQKRFDGRKKDLRDLQQDFDAVQAALENKKAALIKQEQELNKVIETESFITAWEATVQPLKDAIRNIQSLDENKARRSYMGADKLQPDQLRKMRDDFVILFDSLVVSKKLDFHAPDYENKPKIQREIDKLVGEDGSAGAVKEAKDKIQELLNFSEGKEVRMAREKIDEHWEKIMSLWTALVNNPTENRVSDSVDTIRELLKYLTPEERQIFEWGIKMRDAVNAASGPEAFRHLGWYPNFRESRSKARVYVDAQELRDFRHMDTDISYFHEDGKQRSINVTTLINKIADDYLVNDYRYLDSQKVKHAKEKNKANSSYDATTDPENFSEYNYAQFGNPDDATLSNGVPKIQDRLKQDFPDLKDFPGFILDTIVHFVILSELRTDRFVRRYAKYKGSPVPGFDAGSIEDFAPMATIMYKAQSGGSLPSHRSFALVAKLPDSIPGNNYEIQNDGKSKPDDHGGKSGGDLVSKANAFKGKIVRNIGVKEVVPADVRALHNLRTFAMVRDEMLYEFAPLGFEFVRMQPDLKIMPSFWDWTEGKWGDMELGAITYNDFNEITKAFHEFEEFIDKVPTLSQPTEVDTLVGNLVDKIKNFKAIFMLLNRNPDSKPAANKNVFVDTVQLLALVYLKRLFEQYQKMYKEHKVHKGILESFKGSRELFLEIAIKIIEEAKTLPSDVSQKGDYPLLHVLEDANGGFLNKFKKWAMFFDDSAVSSEDPLLNLQRNLGAEFVVTYQNWLRDPSVAEKDPNK